MEVAVIGAGPAGLCSAVALIGRGLDVTLFERRSRIRSTPCADGIPVGALETLRAVTGFDSTGSIDRVLPGGRLVFPSGYSCKLFDAGEIALLHRQHWLEALADHVIAAGGELRFEAPVRAIDRDRHRLTVGDGTEVRYRWAVNASGPAGFEPLDCPRGRAAQAILDMGSHHHPTRYGESTVYLDTRYSAQRVYVIPKRDRVAVGLGGGFDALERFIEDNKLPGKPIERVRWPIPAGGTVYRANGQLYIGDSCGLASPLNGEGLAPIVDASVALADALAAREPMQYVRTMERTHTPLMERHARFAALLEAMSNAELDALGRVLDGGRFSDLFRSSRRQRRALRARGLRRRTRKALAAVLDEAVL